MSIYEKEFSSFPAKNITRHNFKNIDDNTASLIDQIKLLRLQGLHEQAADIIKENKEILERSNIDSVVFRTWEEEIFNTQKYAKQRQQIVFFDEEEPECLEGDVWISECMDGGDN